MPFFKFVSSLCRACEIQSSVTNIDDGSFIKKKKKPWEAAKADLKLN
jgi:hypothetical protein